MTFATCDMCDDETDGGKPMCLAHIRLMPYVADVLDQDGAMMDDASALHAGRIEVGSPLWLDVLAVVTASTAIPMAELIDTMSVYDLTRGDVTRLIQAMDKARVVRWWQPMGKGQGLVEVVDD